MTRSCIGLICTLWATACAGAPTLTPAAGKIGAYVHLDSDGSSSRSGLVMPGQGWPPASHKLQGECADEKERVEIDLGIESKACPRLQALPLPAAGHVASADDEISQGPSLDIRCYELGSALLVIEYAQTAVRCSHIIGLAVFKQGNEVR